MTGGGGGVSVLVQPFANFKPRRAGYEVRVSWEKQYMTQIVRKSTPNFAKFLSLVLIRPIFTKRCMDCRISFNIGPIKTKLEDFVNLGFIFLTLWVSCCFSQNKRTRIQPHSV